jgi:O-antigen ligase
MPVKIDHQLRILFSIFALFCLTFTMTNFLPFSALMVFLAPFVAIWYSLNNKMSPLVFSLVLMLSYFVLSTLLYMPYSFLSYEFYRRDGNVFISFLPLLLYAPIAFKLNLERMVGFFLFGSAATTIFLVLTYSLFNLNVDDQGTHHFLFYAHNAAGGFFSIVAAVALGYYLHTRSKLYLLLFAILFVGLLMTKSRGSILGFGCAFISSVIFRERFNTWFVFGAFVAFAGLMSQAYPLWIEVGMPIRVFTYEYLPEGMERAGTILERAMILWPRAIYLWLKSPIFGAGFGSYNDTPYELVGIENVFMINSVAKPSFDAGHAHHSYFHILAETGIVGFSLVMYFLRNIYKFLVNVESSGLRRGMLIAFWVVVWSSLSEHRLFTPSQMLPFMIILGLMLAVSNGREELEKPSYQASA